MSATEGAPSTSNSGEPDGEKGVEAKEEPEAKEMKAVILTSYGGLKSVKVMKKVEPSVTEGEVIIRVKCCGLGFPDLMLRQGAVEVQTRTPFVMGNECAGIVEAIGEGVSGLKVGDRVAALTESNAWAELVSVPVRYVYKIPDNMDFKEAVALTLNYVVAHSLLFDVGNLREGQTVLIHSVGGGVGGAVVQLAKSVKNVTLIGTASKEKGDLLKDGIHHFLDHTIDYVTEVKKIAPDGVDLVLDCLCGDDTNKGYNLLKPMGRYVLYGTAFIVAGETKSLFSFAKSWWQVDKISPLKLYDENRTVSGFNLRKLLFQQDQHDYVRNRVNVIYDLWKKKKVTPIIDSIWAFEDVPEAMQKMHDRRNVGKVLIDPEKEGIPKPVEEESRLARLRKFSTRDSTKSVDEKPKEAEDKKLIEEENETEK